jgi:hypothetical protein
LLPFFIDQVKDVLFQVSDRGFAGYFKFAGKKLCFGVLCAGRRGKASQNQQRGK